MSKSQNTKNEQQKDLCITSEQLTEQWKKGELLEGFYYVKCDWSDEVEIRYVHNGVDDWKEIVAPVPSYEEWQRIFHYASKYESEYTSCAMDYENLKQENTQLKDLLKEIRGKLHYINTPKNRHNIFDNYFMKKIDEVLK